MAVKQRIFHLGNDFGLTPEIGSKKLRDIFPTDAAAQSALPWAWKAARGALLNLPAEHFRELYAFTAIMLNAVYFGEAEGNLSSGYLNTFNSVVIPPGKYRTNANIPAARGITEGANSFGYWDPGNGGEGSATTEIVMARDYLGNPAELYGLTLPNLHLSRSGNNQGYNESARVRNLCFTNEGGTGGSKRRIGLMLNMPGEVSAFDNIRANGFDIGIAIEGATPVTGGDCSVFDNRIAGVATLGGALSTATVATISGDRNGSLFRQLPGLRGEPAGGSFGFSMGKGEDSNIQGQGAYGSQVIAWCSGQFVVVVHNCRPTTEDRINDAAFVVNPYIIHDGQLSKQSSLLKATGQGHQYNTLIHDLGTGERIPWPGNYKAFDFSWSSDDNSFFSPLTAGRDPMTGQPASWKWEKAGSMALGSAERDPMTGGLKGTFNYAAGTPVRNDDRALGYVGTQGGTGICKVPMVVGATPEPPPAPPTEPPATPAPEPPTPEPPVPPVPEPPPAGAIPDRSKWKATASASWPNGQPAKAIDADPNSAWTNGRAQQPGEWLQVDLSAAAKVSSVTFTLGASPWDFPAGWKIQGSTDGKTWTDMTTGNGKYGTPMTATGSWSIRYVRLYVTKANGTMWVTVGNVEIK